MILVTGATGSIGRHLVRCLRQRRVPFLPLKARGLPAGFADDVAALAGEVAGGALAVTTPAVHDLTGRAPRTFDQFITVNVAAMEAALGGRSHGR